MVVVWRNRPKCVKCCTPKSTSLFDSISIKEKCVQNVKELLGISKNWKDIINFLCITGKDFSFF